MTAQVWYYPKKKIYHIGKGNKMKKDETKFPKLSKISSGLCMVTGGHNYQPYTKSRYKMDGVEKTVVVVECVYCGTKITTTYTNKIERNG